MRARGNMVMFRWTYTGFLLGALVLNGCQASRRMEDYAPDRLPTVPETASWAGWIDGGAWVECFLDQERNANWCTVWDDQDGQVAVRTHFVLKENGKPASESELQYKSASATYIVLSDGRVLEPLAFHGKNVDPWATPPIEPPRKKGSPASSEPEPNDKTGGRR